MQILIKTLTGQRVPFDFEPCDTVAQVKRILQESERRRNILRDTHRMQRASNCSRYGSSTPVSAVASRHLTAPQADTSRTSSRSRTTRSRPALRYTWFYS
ncbi:hypothetical protein, conserved [Babesia bigemina]|uniref:Ubiquitin-like domain-containing protein n=1 Tax=Babesia bigemina TaxID=5866 RepID=A0A061D8J7_BABBI|nr:hypothetical protein, conserved [Babesia bigemina]CDR94070.1 hypothetical protein, conserved [Babesia bigemina]|eukprot:XP_012766256.1 hypothetical protein, conserved [Babesia bigemina]